MSVFTLKIIGIVTMLVDHIGVAFFPSNLLFESVGRLAFPIFAWLIANGFRHTKNKAKYISRLSLLALVSEIPFQLVLDTNFPEKMTLNIGFTLLLGIFGIYLYEKASAKYQKLSVVVFGSVLAELTSIDYGAYGFLSILLFHIYFKDVKKMLEAQALLLAGIFGGSFVYSQLFIDQPFTLTQLPIQILAFIGVLFVAKYNGELGRKSKYFFYIFYPLHLLLIYFTHVYLI